MDPQGLGLAVLTGMIAPAVLISACGPLLLSTTIRFGRIVDRVRDVAARLEELVHGPATILHAGEKRKMYLDQLDALSRRARLMQRAMITFYVAIGAFIGAMVAIGAFAFLGTHQDWVAVVIGLIGTFSLLYGSVLLIIESRLGLESVHTELDYINALGQRHRE
jgi:hypothetical protein